MTRISSDKKGLMSSFSNSATLLRPSVPGKMFRWVVCDKFQTLVYGYLHDLKAIAISG